MVKDKIHRLMERFVEIVFSLFFLLTIFPLIYIVMAIVVKRYNPGPVIVQRSRMQTGGSQFLAYRFRVHNEDSFLARIPQLINILKGEIPIHISVSIDEGEPTFVEETVVEPVECMEIEESVYISNIDNNTDNDVNI